MLENQLPMLALDKLVTVEADGPGHRSWTSKPPSLNQDLIYHGPENHRLSGNP